MLEILRNIEAEWIVTTISVFTALMTILVAYTRWRIDKGGIDEKFIGVDKRFEKMEKELSEHIEFSNKIAEQNRQENREDHHSLFNKIDEIKNLLIGHDFKKK